MMLQEVDKLRLEVLKDMDTNIQTVGLQQFNERRGAPAYPLLVQQPWYLLLFMSFAVYMAYGPWSFTLKGIDVLKQDIMLRSVHVHVSKAFATTFAIAGCYSPHLRLSFCLSAYSMVTGVLISWILGKLAVELEGLDIYTLQHYLLLLLLLLYAFFLTRASKHPNRRTRGITKISLRQWIYLWSYCAFISLFFYGSRILMAHAWTAFFRR